MQEAAQVQFEINECDKRIAVLISQKKAAEAKLAEILRANERSMQAYIDRLQADMLFLQAFQKELNNKQDFERLAQEACDAFLKLIEALKAEQKLKSKSNYRVLADSVALVADLAKSVRVRPINFENIHRQYEAVEAYAYRLDEGRPSRRKLGFVMRKAGAALIILAGVVLLAAAISFFMCPVLLPAVTILIGVGAGFGLLLGLNLRASGKTEIEGSKRDPEGLPHRLLMFGDALKDKATRRGPEKISVFEGCRRRWFR